MNHYKFYGLLKQMPGADKEQIVRAASGFTTSLSEFAEKDTAGYWRMVATMAKTVDGGEGRAATQGSPNNAETKRLRSAILHRLQKYGIDTTDWAKVNAFLELPQVAGKKLYDITNDEMTALIPKLHAIMAKEKARLEADAVAAASKLKINN